VIANLLGVQLPSDAVRVKSVSGLEIPLNPHESALVEARVEANFRFVKDKSSWRVTGVRTGTRGWIDPAAILDDVNKGKTARAQTELQSIAKALEDFRAKRGSYVESKSEAVLIDFLSPGFLSRVIRFDPWHRPYHYEGTRDHFTLSSTGPDGKENTGDDIVLSGPTRSAQTTYPR
jgi:Tfp pilus assembly protein PilE